MNKIPTLTSAITIGTPKSVLPNGGRVAAGMKVNIEDVNSTILPVGQVVAAMHDDGPSRPAIVGDGADDVERDEARLGRQPHDVAYRHPVQGEEVL